jgi:hypothetical protein
MTQYVQEKVARLENPVTAWMLLSVIVALLFAYAYFVNGTIQNIVEAKDMKAKISSLTSSVSNLESEYLAERSTMSLSYAKSLGYSESSVNPIYIQKKGQSSISFNR